MVLKIEKLDKETKQKRLEAKKKRERLKTIIKKLNEYYNISGKRADIYAVFSDNGKYHVYSTLTPNWPPPKDVIVREYPMRQYSMGFPRTPCRARAWFGGELGIRRQTA
ncbi:uncharacterized protein F4822DRAFT_423530 [Hypoxylon trugodes]|uniref:uncharacterized protein n=1 Tax=Hypoxylon trugodes TaxID=326681 RepID=UPI0021988736|nr:uncharacterized protein F4822DRAFT_423530 [Hypoxylon trugodes]KAI1382522.1 hypothetical protein F4822DRAFT_423530 [Hypoxylon trugodes]